MTQLIVQRFLTPDGRLRALPVKRSKLIPVLEHLAQSFEIDHRYSEPEVNDILHQFDPDHALLRRCLVDHGLLERDHGLYWRPDPRE